jgi:hypothetical protein
LEHATRRRWSRERASAVLLGLRCSGGCSTGQRISRECVSICRVLRKVRGSAVGASLLPSLACASHPHCPRRLMARRVSGSNRLVLVFLLLLGVPPFASRHPHAVDAEQLPCNAVVVSCLFAASLGRCVLFSLLRCVVAFTLLSLLTGAWSKAPVRASLSRDPFSLTDLRIPSKDVETAVFCAGATATWRNVDLLRLWEVRSTSKQGQLHGRHAPQ